MALKEFYDEEDLEQDLADLAALDGAPLPIVIFNGPICTTNGLYRLSDLSAAEAKKLLKADGFISAVGHEASAQVLSELLGVEISMNRIQYSQSAGQKAIVLNLNYRAPEGRVLSREEMLEVGFELKLLERLK